jgi:hypothetical protein
MATSENDVSGQEAATAREGKFTQAARKALHSEAPSAAEIGSAIAEAMKRAASNPAPAQVLGEVVRCSVRAQTKDTRQVASDGSSRIVTSYVPVRFAADETADGKELELTHGKPVRLKRDAFHKYASMGRVVLAE